MGITKALFTEWQIDAAWAVVEATLRQEAAVLEDREMTDCTCLPLIPDDQCPLHGYEAWKALREQTGVWERNGAA